MFELVVSEALLLLEMFTEGRLLEFPDPASEKLKVSPRSKLTPEASLEQLPAFFEFVLLEVSDPTAIVAQSKPLKL